MALFRGRGGRFGRGQTQCVKQQQFVGLQIGDDAAYAVGAAVTPFSLKRHGNTLDMGAAQPQRLEHQANLSETVLDAYTLLRNQAVFYQHIGNCRTQATGNLMVFCRHNCAGFSA